MRENMPQSGTRAVVRPFKAGYEIGTRRVSQGDTRTRGYLLAGSVVVQ